VPPCVNTVPVESVRETESRREAPRKVRVVVFISAGMVERSEMSLNQVPWAPPQ
jgi:hypothetical protein